MTAVRFTHLPRGDVRAADELVAASVVCGGSLVLPPIAKYGI